MKCFLTFDAESMVADRSRVPVRFLVGAEDSIDDCCTNVNMAALSISESVCIRWCSNNFVSVSS